jgi:lipopolysaccharide/colanic/teichoic acid biosynthesis glycosyltransferase
LAKLLVATVVEISNHKMQHKLRYVPFLRNFKIRTIIGVFLLILSVFLSVTFFGKGQAKNLLLIIAFAWLPAVFLTDKYVHKYPQRYYTYLVASHLKAAIVMALVLFIAGIFTDPFSVPRDVLWTAFMLFIFMDALVSVPRHRDIPSKQLSAIGQSPGTEKITDNRPGASGGTDTEMCFIDTQIIVSQIRYDFDKPLVEFIEKNLPDSQGPNGTVLVIDDLPTKDDQSAPASVGLLIGRTRINDVRRLNQFLQFCAKRITMGGYFLIMYVPLETVLNNLKKRYPGLLYWPVFILHFIWYRAIPKIPKLDRLYFSPIFSWIDTLHFSVVKRRNRVLSKAEVWGRLAFYGMRVIAESKGNDELYVIAQRESFPVLNKIPSYYPIVALEKVGLNGEIIRMHKLRTMYPFSEFLQKRIFEDHGLTATGKFRDDFRLTDYGKLLRKYWLDELPQIFDWLRGDVKLVGMRATSRHFLSLYPKELYDLYIQIKPGLVPPIFDESTNGFDQIVKVELTYLQRYWDKPFQTDIRYLMQTFNDIVIRGIRSK